MPPKVAVTPKVRVLNNNETGQVFGEAIGAVTYYEWFKSQSAAKKHLQLVEFKIQGRVGLTDLEQERLDADIRHSIILQLGYLTFVVPWERYKKLVDPKLDDAEGSTVFGLDGYSDNGGDALKSDYPGTTIKDWSNTKLEAFWFAAKLRNALAHGQASWVTTTTGEEIELCNITPAKVDFKIQMPVAQFVKLLVTHALVQFVGKVTAGEHYEPLYSIIAKYRLDGPIALGQ